MHTQLNLKKLSNQDLDQSFASTITKEREVLSEAIRHIVEVERRKLYLTFAYPNLFEYLTKHLGYSAGSAHRRLEMARLTREIPSVLSDVESGKLNMSQVSIIQRAVRQVQTESKTKVSTQIKELLLTELHNKSFQDSQVLIHQALNIQIKQQPQIKFQKDDSVRLEVTLSKSQWQKLTKMRELLSHSLPNGSWDQVLEYVSDKIIQQKDKTLEAKQVKSTTATKHIDKSAFNDSIITGNLLDRNTTKLEKSIATDTQPESMTPRFSAIPKTVNTSMNLQCPAYVLEQNTMNSSRQAYNSEIKPFRLQQQDEKREHIPMSLQRLVYKRKHIPMNLQRQIYKRDQVCQHVDKYTHRKCTSKWKLTIDHIQPIWDNGTNDINNLRLLCANHNQMRYKQQSKISKF